MHDSPFNFFQAWFDEAKRKQLPQFDAMTLVTATAQGKPSARLVLLKGVNADLGFHFFTNYESRKARELRANPQAQLLFYWPQLGHQIRVEGGVARLSTADSDAYFASRPRGSQIGAHASRQSQPLGSMAELRERVRLVEAEFAGHAIPRPENWGGFELRADRIEFWQDGQDRLHERIIFTRSAGIEHWEISRLYP